MRNTLLTLFAATALIGCVGGVDGVDPPDEAPGPNDPNNPNNPGNSPLFAESKALYETTVQPIMAAKCISCHAATGAVSNSLAYVTATPTDSYVTARSVVALIGDGTPTGAPILTKINNTAVHNAQTYSTADTAAITAWLNKELEARAATPGGQDPDPGAPAGETPAAATLRVTKEWSGCMTLANFTAANMKAWANVRADNSACQTCHAGGAYGHIAVNEDVPFFNTISTNKYYLAQYFSVDLAGGPAAAKMAINTRAFQNVGQGIAPHQAHPRFNPTNNAGMTALQNFYDRTMALKTAGTCGAPTLTN